MAGGIDHLVLCVRDLQAARERYRRLGFTLTPPARHPFGTANSLVQLDGSFLELLTVAEPERIPAMGGRFFSFGAFNRDFLARQEGCSMLVLESQDALADNAAWRAAGLGEWEPFHFERQAQLPDGRSAKVAFTLAFATDPGLPEAVVFACQQHAPELFWKAEYQRHANTAHGVAEVALVAEDPAQLDGFLHKLTGTAAVAHDGLRAETGRGAILVTTPDRFRASYGVAPPALSHGPRFAGCRIEVADLGRLRTILAADTTAVIEGEGALVVPPADCFGLALAFAQRSKR